MKRIIAMLLAIALLVGNVPVQAFATEGEIQEAANAAPALLGGSSATEEIVLGSEYALDLSAVFTDSDPLTYSVRVNGGEAQTIDAFYTYTPTEKGTYELSFTATDGSSTSEAYTVTLTANPVELALGEKYSLDLSLLYTDVDAFQYLVSVNGGAVEAVDKDYSFTPGTTGNYKLEFFASYERPDAEPLNVFFYCVVLEVQEPVQKNYGVALTSENTASDVNNFDALAIVFASDSERAKVADMTTDDDAGKVYWILVPESRKTDKINLVSGETPYFSIANPGVSQPLALSGLSYDASVKLIDKQYNFNAQDKLIIKSQEAWDAEFGGADTPACEHSETTTEYVQVEGSKTHTVTKTCANETCGQQIGEVTTADCVDADTDGKCDMCKGAVEAPKPKLNAPSFNSTMTSAKETSITVGVEPDWSQASVLGSGKMIVEISKTENFAEAQTAERLMSEVLKGKSDFTFTGLDAGTSYYIRAKITGVDSHQDSDYSTTLNVTTKEAPKPKVGTPSLRVSGTAGTPDATETSVSAMADPDFSQMGILMGCSTTKMIVEISKTEDFASVLETKEKLMSEVMGGGNGQLFAFTGLDDGTTYYLRAKVTSVDGYQDSDYSAVVKATTMAAPEADKTAPSISVAVDKSASDKAVVSVTATDDVSAADKLVYSFDGGTTWDSVNTKTYTENTTIAADTIQVKDEAGNIARYGAEIVVDHIPAAPSITEVKVVENGTYSATVVVVAEIEDDTVLEYSFDNGSTWSVNSAKTYAQNITLGVNAIQVRAGSVVMKYDQQVRISNIQVQDATKPVISNVVVTPNGTTSATVTVTASDSADTLLWYSFDGGNTWGTDTSRTFTVNCKLEAGSVMVKDAAGNTASYGTAVEITNIVSQESLNYGELVVKYGGQQLVTKAGDADNTYWICVPENSAGKTLDSAKLPVAGTNGLDYSGQISSAPPRPITIDFTDAGVTVYRKNSDGLMYWSIETKFYFLTPAAWAAKFDDADTVAPEVYVTVTTDKVTSATVTVNAVDADKSSLLYSFDGGSTWTTGKTKTYTENVEIAANQIQVRDAMQNVGKYGQTISITNLQKDETAPAIVKVEVEKVGTGSANVTVTAKDAGSDALKYSFDNGNSWTANSVKTYKQDTTLASDTIWVKDASGNIAKYPGVIVISGLDSTAPVINGVTFQVNEDSSYATVTVNAQDDVSEELFYSFDSGKTWQSDNTRHYVDNTTVAKNTIQVKDEADNIAKYDAELNITGVQKLVEEIPANQNGNGTTGVYLDKIVLTGLNVDGVTWYDEKVVTSDPENIYYTEYWLNIHLDSNTLDDAAFDIRGTFASGNVGTCSVTGDKFLVDGKADITLITKAYNKTSITYHIHLDTKQTTVPTINGDKSVTVSRAASEEYKVDLSKVFSDADNDPLTYFLVANSGEKQEIEKDFSYSSSIGGSYVFKFQAYDGLKLSETYTVNLTVTDSEETYTLNLQMPEDITPKFYITTGFDDSGVDILGKELSSNAGTAQDGVVVHTITIPANIERISFRGTDQDGTNWGGMSMKADDVTETLAVRTVVATVPNKLNNNYVTSEQVKFSAGYDTYFAQSGSNFANDEGILSYRFLLLCRAYFLTAEPAGSAVNTYSASRKEITLATGNGVAEYELPLASSYGLNITVPSNAKLELGQKILHYIPYNLQEPTDVVSNGDGTTTYSFNLASNTRYSYFIDMEGYAKYCSSFTMNDRYKENGITITADQIRATDANYINRELGAVGNGTAAGFDEELGEQGWVGIHSGKNVADIYLSINAQGYLNLNQGATYQIRHNRSWQILENTVTKTHTAVYEPNYHYQVVDGNGNASNVVSIDSNGMMTANAPGTAIVLVTYDALNSPSSGGVYSAIWPENTGVFVVTVGGNGSVDTGISKDAEHDHFYYLEGQSGAQFTFTPEAGSTVTLLRSTLNGNAPMSYNGGFTSDGVIKNADGSVTVTLTTGRNIVKVAKNGAASYQVLTAKEVSCTITNKTSSDGKYHPGDSIQIRFNTVYHPVSKLAAIYNQGAELRYTADNGDSVTGGYNQYCFGYDAKAQTITFTIPEAWTGDSYSLRNGVIHVDGLGEFPTSHRTKIDWVNGMAANMNAGQNNSDWGKLPDITLNLNSTDNHKPVLKNEEATLVREKITLGQTFQLNLGNVFTDEDGNTLTYSVAIGEDDAVAASASYSYKPEEAGIYRLAFIANDGTANSEAYNVYLEVAQTSTTPVIPTFDVTNPDGYVTVSFVDYAPRKMEQNPDFPYALGEIIAPTEVPFMNGDSIADVTTRLLDAMNIGGAYSSKSDGFYLSAIKNFTVDGVPYESFGEFDAGPNSGWMITQNNWFINLGASEFDVEDGDIIEWQYTCATGADVGHDYGKPSAEIVGITFKESYGTLAPEFEKSVENYVYTIPAAVKSISLETVMENYGSIVTYKVGETKYKPMQAIPVENGTDIIIDSAYSDYAYELPKDRDRVTITIQVDGSGEVTPPTDQELAQVVIDLIAQIGSPITLDSEEKIKAARTAYDTLNDDQKALVTNLDVLEAAEAKLEELKESQAPSWEVAYKAVQASLNAQAKTTAPVVGSISGEWLAMGLTRSGADASAWKNAYLSNVANIEYAVENPYRIDKNKATENVRVVLALTALGIDPRNVEGVNLLAGLNEMKYITKQGINGPVFTLIALDAHQYDEPSGEVTREKLIRHILDNQLPGGGWTQESQVDDMTAMTIQALAPYYRTNAEVKTAVDKALGVLSGLLKEKSYGGCFNNAESEAQVIVALTALGIDPATDSRFINADGKNLLDALMSYYLPSSTKGAGFAHYFNGNYNQMATEQSFYALVAYSRFKNEQRSFYDMNDVTLGKFQNPDKEAAKAVIALINSIPTPVTKNSKDAIDAARDAYDKLTDNQRKLVTNYETLTDAEEAYAEIIASEADRAAAADVIAKINAIGTVTKNSKAKIDAARNAYDALTPVQKNLVTNYSKLEDAEAAYKKLEAQDTISGYVTISFEDYGKRRSTELSEIDAAFKNPLGSIIAPTKVAIKSGDTIASVTLRLLASEGIQAKYEGDAYNSFYLASIKLSKGWFGEFDAGKDSGWMITWNSWFINQGASEFTVKDGDVIRWQYTCQLGADIGDPYYDNNSSGSNSSNNSTGNTDTAVKNVISLINAIGTVTLDSEDAIKEARKAYNALSEANKKKVTNYSKLTEAETKLEELKKQPYAKVIALINAIGNVTLNSEEKIIAARTAYDQLSADQKKLVTNYATLTAAEAAFEAKKGKPYAMVEALIEKIGVVSIDSKVAIEAARKAYDALSESEKKLVPNYDVLLDAEKDYAALLKKADTSVEDIYRTVGDYLAGQTKKYGLEVGSIGGEWLALGLARSGREVPADYYEKIVAYVRENINEQGQLHRSKSTDNSRLIVALTAIGKDPRDVDGYNLLMGLSSMDYLVKQGNNGPIWALIALDTMQYQIPDGWDVTREKLIQYILDVECEIGGWNLYGEDPDTDMTGMAIQALAPYYTRNEDVKEAVDRALTWLSSVQLDNGAFAAHDDGATAESTAQVIVALAALGINPDTNTRFIKNGNSVIDGLCSFYVTTGGFKHLLDGEMDGMATEQAYYALVAYFRLLNGESRLYAMGKADVVETTPSEPTETTEMTEPVLDIVDEEQSGSGVIWIVLPSVAGVSSLAALWLLLKKKKLF